MQWGCNNSLSQQSRFSGLKQGSVLNQDLWCPLFTLIYVFIIGAEDAKFGSSLDPQWRSQWKHSGASLVKKRSATPSNVFLSKWQNRTTLFCPFHSTTSIFPSNPPIWCVYHKPPGSQSGSHSTACSFCFGLRAEGLRPIKQTELLMCQYGSHTLVSLPAGNHETNGGDRRGSAEDFRHVSNVSTGGRLTRRDRQIAALGYSQHMDAGCCTKETCGIFWPSAAASYPTHDMALHRHECRQWKCIRGDPFHHSSNILVHAFSLIHTWATMHTTVWVFLRGDWLCCGSMLRDRIDSLQITPNQTPTIKSFI